MDYKDDLGQKRSILSSMKGEKKCKKKNIYIYKEIRISSIYFIGSKYQESHLTLLSDTLK